MKNGYERCRWCLKCSFCNKEMKNDFMNQEKYIKDFTKLIGIGCNQCQPLLCDYSVLPEFYRDHKADVPAKLYKYLPMSEEYYWNTLFNKQAWFSFALRDMAIFEDNNDSVLIYDIENSKAVKKLETIPNSVENLERLLEKMKDTVKYKMHDNGKAYSKDWQRYDNCLVIKNCEEDLAELDRALSQLTDESDCFQIVKEVHRDLMSRHLETDLKRIGIFSLTTSFQNEYMWKNYAADYSGICLAYETLRFPIPVFPILYREKHKASLTELFGIGEITTETLKKNAFIRFLIKDKEKYERENEWRGLAAVDKCKDFSQQPLKGFAVDDFKPCKIYIGEKMNESTMARLKKFCLQENIPTEIYQNKNVFK